MGRARAPRDEMAVDPTAPSPGAPAALEPGVALGRNAIEGEGGVGPYKLALRRLRRNKTALVFGAIFLLIVFLCLCAPLYAKHVAHTTPSANHITDQITVRGKTRDVVSPGGIPTGPTWTSKFLFGADSNGRDVAVRLLYGGRNSLEIGFIATFISCFFATVIALSRGVLPRSRGRRPLADHGPDLGLPGDPARDRTRHRAGDRRPRLRPVHRQRGILIHPGDHHRRRLRPVHGEAASGSGAELAGEGVHRGRPGPGRREHHESCSGRSSRTSPRASSSSSR